MPAPPCGNYGDISGDGNITMLDVMIVTNYLDGNVVLTPDQLIRADVDGDGKVTSNDALLISKYSASSITTFPICSQTKPIKLIIPIGAMLKVDGNVVI